MNKKNGINNDKTGSLLCHFQFRNHGYYTRTTMNNTYHSHLLTFSLNKLSNGNLNSHDL